jgi:hypothetical protein
MTKQTVLLIAVAGVSLLAASHAQAANTFGYATDDLVLNFRNTANIGDNDLEINMGPISAIAAFTGTETVIAGGPSGLLQTVYPVDLSAGNVGFSADAADAVGTTGLLWLTRAESAANTPGANPVMVPYSIANPVTGMINTIGLGANAGTILSQGVAEVTGSTSGNSFQAQAEAGTSANNQAVINFGGELSIADSKGGLIESISDGTDPVYEGLWKQPTSTSGGSDSYLGYFTFQPNGEVDYTSAVPEPSTYVLLAVTGMLAWAFRRRIRALIA